MKALLGTNTLPSGDAIIEESRSGTNYFARGHLSPDAAFIYDAEQDATYYFMNVAPQFQSFNNGNWKSLEMATRKYAEEEAKGDVKVGLHSYGIGFQQKSGNFCPQLCMSGCVDPEMVILILTHCVFEPLTG